MRNNAILPVDWVSTLLERVVDTIVGGGTPSKSNTSYYEGDISWMTVKDMNKHILLDTIDHITQKAVDNSSTNIIPAGTPIIATRMSLGKIVIAEFDSAINQDLKALFINHNIVTSYLVYWYRSQAEFIESLGTGTTVKGIRLEVLRDLSFPLAPLAEQKQISTKLDELLAQVDIIKTRLDTIPTILKHFRQSALAAAVSGKLTEEWRKDNPPIKSISQFKEEIREYRFKLWAEAQLAKYKDKGKIPKNDVWKQKYKEPVVLDDEVQKDLPEGWVHEVLDGLVYIAARIGWKGLKASEYTKNGPLFLSVHSLNYGQYVNLNEAFHISEERYEESPEIKLTNDDILLCKDGAGIGKIAIVKGLDLPASINSSLLLIRAGKYFKTEYLYYFLAGPVMQKLVQERMTGTAVPHLFQRDVKEFVLEIPPIDEQSEIVRRVEQLFSFADQIEERVKDTQSRVNNLTQSILAKAFRGELTAEWRKQNPDLISSKNSAEVLLERVMAERNVATPKKHERKAKG